MKPYLESIRKLSRVGFILLALTIVASAFMSIQYCTVQYQDNVPSMTKMFTPLIVMIYVGGVVFAMEGFSFLNKRSDSDFYHSLPVSRKRLFWAISLAALTVSRAPDARIAVHRAMSPKQIVAESHRAFEISARQP